MHNRCLQFKLRGKRGGEGTRGPSWIAFLQMCRNIALQIFATKYVVHTQPGNRSHPTDRQRGPPLAPLPYHVCMQHLTHPSLSCLGNVRNCTEPKPPPDSMPCHAMLCYAQPGHLEGRQRKSAAVEGERPGGGILAGLLSPVVSLPLLLDTDQSTIRERHVPPPMPGCQ